MGNWGFCHEGGNVSVNVSARQLTDARFVADLQAAIRESGIDPSRLQLEVAESTMAVDSRLAVTLLSELKQFGMGVTIDDFGTGDSTLIGLRQFAADALRSTVHWSAKCWRTAARVTLI
jgi:EAL domain-containing protein (putative c-di-GMP-specific phosphodiesterase class I)